MRSLLIIFFFVCGVCFAQLPTSEFDYWWAVKSGGGSPPELQTLCFDDTGGTICNEVEVELVEAGTFNGAPVYKAVSAPASLFPYIYWDTVWAGWVYNSYDDGSSPLDPGFVEGDFPIYFLGSNISDALDYPQGSVLCTADFLTLPGFPLTEGACGTTPPILEEFCYVDDTAGAGACADLAGTYIEDPTFDPSSVANPVLPTGDPIGFWNGQKVYQNTVPAIGLYLYWSGSSWNIGVTPESGETPADWYGPTSTPLDSPANLGVQGLCYNDLVAQGSLSSGACSGPVLEEITVDDAGTSCAPQCAGVYTEAGTFNGQPYYERISPFLRYIWWDSGSQLWFISFALGSVDPSGGAYSDFDAGGALGACAVTFYCDLDILPISTTCSGGGGGGGGDFTLSGAQLGMVGDGADANGDYTDQGVNTDPNALPGSKWYLNNNGSGYRVFRETSGYWFISKSFIPFSCTSDDWYSDLQTYNTPCDVANWFTYCGLGLPVGSGTCP